MSRAEPAATTAPQSAGAQLRAMPGAVSGGLRPKRIVVTGGAGFLGSYLCERLVAAGHEVLCIDELDEGLRRTVAHFRAVLPSPAVAGGE